MKINRIITSLDGDLWSFSKMLCSIKYYSVYKKSVLTLILVLTSFSISFGQENETVLKAPDNWISEIIPFPLGFARSIDFVGFEDLRFAPTWSDSTSAEFWTYTFVWYIEKDSAMTEKKLTESFNSYYDGLMGVDIRNESDSSNLNQLDKTLTLFIKTNEGFTGKIRVYDRFFTKDYMTLNIKVEESFCTETNKQIILCELSPQPFDHEVWNMFEDVEVMVNCD